MASPVQFMDSPSFNNKNDSNGTSFDQYFDSVISSTNPNELGISSQTHSLPVDDNANGFNNFMSPIFEETTKVTQIINFTPTDDFLEPIHVRPIVQKKVPTLNLSKNISLQKKKEKKKICAKKVTRKRRQKKKKIVKIDDDVNDPWYTSYSVNTFNGILQNLKITCKTRCESPVEYIPNTLYSSLKYEVRVCVDSGSIDCEKYPFFLARIKVVHSEKFNEIFKNGKTVIKGDCEQALTKVCSKNGMVNFDGKMKVQFTDVSYHHKKHNFRFEVHLYVPNDLHNAIWVRRSGEFKVFARKPSSRVGKKRKRNNLKVFEEKLSDMMRSAKRLKPNEKEKAYALVSKRLHDLDPEFFNFLSNDEFYNSDEDE